jgi:hypothetical protein
MMGRVDEMMGFDVVVQMLRDRRADDRSARERRQKLYRQHLKSDATDLATTSPTARPDRQERVRTQFPCRISPEARIRLEWLRRAFPGARVAIARADAESQNLVLTARGGGDARTIGRIENRIAADPDAPDHGVTIEIDDDSTLVVRCSYSPVSLAANGGSGREVALTEDSSSDLRCEQAGATASVLFTETRPALEPRSPDRVASPRIACTMRSHELSMMRALESRDFDAFYPRFKREVLSGIWTSLHTVLGATPRSIWYEGVHYTAVRKVDPGIGRICQTTVDDAGFDRDIGANRVYDACSATDILLLYLDGDVLADFASIYLRLHSLGSPEAPALKEEFFAVIRRFWAASDALASRYAADRPAVLRISQRAQPMPAQVSLLERDWIDLRQRLIDRFGPDGRVAVDIPATSSHRSRAPRWPFASFTPGDVNIGLRVVYVQEWHTVAAQRGRLIRTVRPTCDVAHTKDQLVESRIIDDRSIRNVASIVADAAAAGTTTMSWARDPEGSFNIGTRSLNCPILTAPISELMTRVASRPMGEPVVTSEAAEDDEATRTYHRLQHRFDITTRIGEIQHVVLVAEQLPAPTEIGVSWVRRHHEVLRHELRDESLREALDALASAPAVFREGSHDRLIEHVRANILTYQRAIWQREDPQQRLLRYRKLGKRVPIDWQFELCFGSELTIEDLTDRLEKAQVDGQFVAYAVSAHVSLEELIDPSGPVGFHGNYAVYRMQPISAMAEAFALLHYFASAYGCIAAEAMHRAAVAIDTGAMVVDVVRPQFEPQAGLIPFEEPAILAGPTRPAVALRTLRPAPEPFSVAGGRLLISCSDQRTRADVPAIRPNRRRSEVVLDYWAGAPFDGSVVIGAALIGRPRAAQGIQWMLNAGERKEKPALGAGASAGRLLLTRGDAPLRPCQLARDDEQPFTGR